MTLGTHKVYIILIKSFAVDHVYCAQMLSTERINIRNIFHFGRSLTTNKLRKFSILYITSETNVYKSTDTLFI